MRPNFGLMAELKPEFQKKIFNNLLENYNRFELSKLLDRAPSLFYHYKNLRIKSLSLNVIKKAVDLTSFSEKDLNNNIIRLYDMKDRIEQMFNKGIEIRRKQIKSWRDDIPKINELIINKKIYFKKWFDKYIKLINFGAREFKSVTRKGNKIKIVYTNYANSKKKTFINYLPAKIKVDNDFQYFFGLWCGDRLGSGRFGIVNKNRELIFYTVNYLKKLYQKPNLILQYHVLAKEKPVIDYDVDQVYVIKSESQKGVNGYAVSVGIKNRILFSFFDYLYKNLDKVLGLLPNKDIFFAGLFDAEGNVFLEDSCFRWACLNEEKVEIYKKYLKKLNLFNRYDGCNLVAYNKKIFAKDILPYLKNPDKINKTNLVCYGFGKLEKRFLIILEIIKDKPSITNSELAKVLKRVKRYAQTRFLENLGYIKTMNYPKQFYITQKGLNEIQGARIQ